ncbi:helix-turn-helix domain-containing protein [Altererythrobacter xixiisoli]|uniref:Helix-turn-helix domain-containing protein n=1 Tax=Croceibacterium xixiisoli TaxID=1476466 RepID=A0A6I4TSS0_9SPHN|nr:helix-turn-helix transcriptional regulator [Croceibacterium xixiisoli]MXO98932.1 helix-turn-helix domain-containing protein [Croceibacterium xixiisoli]
MLRQERKQRSLKLADLAREIDLSVPYLSQIETGAKPVRHAHVARIIHKLGLDADTETKLRRAAALSASQYVIALPEGAQADDRILAAQIAAMFSSLTPDQKEALRVIFSSPDNVRYSGC